VVRDKDSRGPAPKTWTTVVSNSCQEEKFGSEYARAGGRKKWSWGTKGKGAKRKVFRDARLKSGGRGPGARAAGTLERSDP